MSKLEESKAILGFRPEQVTLTTTDDHSAIKGRVILVENLGMFKLVTVHVENSAHKIRALLDANTDWTEQELWLSIAQENCH